MSSEEVAGPFGRATIAPDGDVVAGAYGSWTITYVVGMHGIDDRGRLLIARRLCSNWGTPQFEHPGEAEYTTAWTSGQARLRLHYDTKAHIRPWKAAIVVQVYDGALSPGDTVTITIGDTRFGGPGSRAQSFREERFAFRALVDPYGTGRCEVVPVSPKLRIIGGPAARLRASAPSGVVVGQPFSLTVVAEDRHGNPADGYVKTMQLSSDAGETILSTPHTFLLPERGAHRFEGLVLDRPGIVSIMARELDGQLAAMSNPIICHEQEPPLRLFWGDLHGQTEASVGTGSLDEYLTFGRDVAALDFISHCANDFQVTVEDWEKTKSAMVRYHQPGRYVTFLAYEWSGTTPAGGDHNVYYLGDEGPLHRSSHWLVDDKSDVRDDRYPLSELQRTLAGREGVMIIPHVGGRHANLDFFEPSFTPFIEIASVHGVFEWLAKEALERGLPVGFVASSDDHTGRPGATYSLIDDTELSMRGGLIGVYAEALTRDELWKAFWARRCYGTTGERIILRVSADGHPMGSRFRAEGAPVFDIEVAGTSPLQAVELWRGTEILYSHPLIQAQPGERPLLRLTWEGARTKWRERLTRWHGKLTLDQGRILSCEPFSLDRPGEGIIRHTAAEVHWRSVTAGDQGGLVLDLDAPEQALLRFQTEPICFDFRLSELVAGPLRVQAGGVGQVVTAAWVPRGTYPAHTRFAYCDESAQVSTGAYWVRVIQQDGALAWSSPIYIDR